MMRDETQLSKSPSPTVKPAEADLLDAESGTVGDLVTETLEQSFRSSDPPSWWAARSPPTEATHPALNRR